MEVPKFGERFFALHNMEGLTGGNGPDNQIILVREEALRKMDPTFQVKPVIFAPDHITGQEYEAIVASANRGANVQGVVNRSFFNDLDGRHWVEFNVWDPEAIKACQQGYGVSNAYLPQRGGGGKFNDLPYDVEVLDGSYDHLLITNKPRFQESKCLTPEEFKQYNEGLKAKLEAVTNQSKGEKVMSLFKFFEKKPMEGAADLAGKEVTLPKSGKTVSLERILNTADETMDKEAKGEMFANMDHKVRLHDNTVCNVGELMEKHKALLEENSRMRNELEEYDKGLQAETEVRKKEAEGGEDTRDKNKSETEEEKKEREKNEAKEKEEREKNRSAADKERLKEIRERIARVKSAPERIGNQAASPNLQPVFVSKQDALKMGTELYGSKKQ